MKAIIGKKIGMSRIFNKKGNAVPVTLILTGPCFVTQIKKTEKDGYNAVQIGYGEGKKINKPEEGHLKKADKKIAEKKLKYLKEIKIDENEEVKVGQEMNVDLFGEGDKVQVTSQSKGKGFAGTIKRHGFHGSPSSHGHKHDLRKPGAIGAAFPEHVMKGVKMAGRMGDDKKSVSNLEVVSVDKEKNILALKGAVPGARNTLVLIKEHK